MIFLLACDDPSPAEEDGKTTLTATAVQADAMDTVMTVTFATDAPSAAWVEWGTDSDFGRVTPGDDAVAAHTITVAGMPAASEIHWRAAAEVDGETVYSAESTVQTRPAPSEVAGFTVTNAVGTRDDFVLVPIIGPDAMVVILDRQGRVTWTWTQSELDLYVTDAAFSRDRQSVLIAAYNNDRGIDESRIDRISLDGATVQTTTTPLGHHAYVELPEGGYAYLKIDVREVNGEPVVGDSIVEIDVDGNLTREVWNSWNVWTPPSPCVEDVPFYPQGCDWVHGNSLTYDEASNQYVFSAHNLDTVVIVDRDSGEMTTSLGREGDIQPDVPFDAQHSPKLLPNGNLLVFDNTETETNSAVREYALTETSATEVWRHESDPGQWCYFLGDETRYADGATLINWGTVGFMAEVDPSGTETWRLETDVGHAFGFHDVADVLGGE